ncbi:PAS domain-containing protein [Streptomyces mirabilis]|uniref:PAS domain S-box protein n=1 Tax=Streptomyces mirabilis TaxID=68239 RepID=UPI0033ECE069
MDITGTDTGDSPVPGPPTRSGALLGALLEDVQTAVVVVDDDGLIVSANGAAQSVLGRSFEELVGQDSHDLLHRDSQGHATPRTRCQLRNALLTGRTDHGDSEWFARGDGTLVRLSWLVAPCSSGSERAGALVLMYESNRGVSDEGVNEVPVPLTELDRLALLAETTTQLTSTLDVDEAMRRLAALTVPRLADWAVIDLFTEQDEVRRALVTEHKDGILVEREDLQGPMPPVPEESPMPLSRALRGAASSLAGPATYQGLPDSGIAVEQGRLFTETGMHSAVIAPIRGLRDVLGALTLGRSKRPGAFTAADLPLLEDITRRAGLALDNARLYQRQRKVAETMLARTAGRSAVVLVRVAVPIALVPVVVTVVPAAVPRAARNRDGRRGGGGCCGRARHSDCGAAGQQEAGRDAGEGALGAMCSHGSALSFTFSRCPSTKGMAAASRRSVGSGDGWIVPLEDRCGAVVEVAA